MSTHQNFSQPPDLDFKIEKDNEPHGSDPSSSRSVGWEIPVQEVQFPPFLCNPGPLFLCFTQILLEVTPPGTSQLLQEALLGVCTLRDLSPDTEIPLFCHKSLFVLPESRGWAGEGHGWLVLGLFQKRLTPKREANFLVLCGWIEVWGIFRLSLWGAGSGFSPVGTSWPHLSGKCPKPA